MVKLFIIYRQCNLIYPMAVNQPRLQLCSGRFHRLDYITLLSKAYLWWKAIQLELVP